MMAVVVAGATFGLGTWFLLAGTGRRPAPLDLLDQLVERPREDSRTGTAGDAGRRVGRSGGEPLAWRLPGAERVAVAVRHAIDSGSPVIQQAIPGAPEDRAITGVTTIELAVLCAYGFAAGMLAPVLLWAAGSAAETASGGGAIVGVDVAAVLMASIACGLAGGYAPVIWHRRRASELRREFRSALSTFVDLVVLALAGGMGVEGALVVGAEAGGHWATLRIGHTLAASRAGGVPSWTALDQLGSELGIGELRELAAALQLAGTEGSRVRSLLAARAGSMRRHQLADAEADANAATERMFLPGALLLVGFLLFVGYPAFVRIVTGI